MLLWMGSSQPGSVKRDELGFTALWRRPLWRRLLGHWGLLLGRAARGCHLWGGTHGPWVCPPSPGPSLPTLYRLLSRTRHIPASPWYSGPSSPPSRLPALFLSPAEPRPQVFPIHVCGPEMT